MEKEILLKQVVVDNSYAKISLIQKRIGDYIVVNKVHHLGASESNFGSSADAISCFYEQVGFMAFCGFKITKQC